MTQVRLHQIHKRYADGTRVIHGIDLEIHDGEFMVFVGPSGCGKSTLLRMIAGLEEITSGELYLGDTLANEIPPANRGLAMVFQSYALYPHMSVFENMAFSLKMAGQSKTSINAAVHKASEILQIQHLLDRKPKDLSGGQRQRVMLAMALALEPEILIADEPTTALDVVLQAQILTLLKKLQAQRNMAMILISHDLNIVKQYADQVLVLNQGRVEEQGCTTEIFTHPQTAYTRNLLNHALCIPR